MATDPTHPEGTLARTSTPGTGYEPAGASGGAWSRLQASCVHVFTVLTCRLAAANGFRHAPKAPGHLGQIEQTQGWLRAARQPNS